MMLGIVRDYSPRIRLTLPGVAGIFQVEGVVDTGFEGELALPSSLARRLDADSFGKRRMLMADGTETECSLCYISLDWNQEIRPTEVLVLEGNPLIGMFLLEGHSLHIEAMEGGEVCIEPL